MTNDFEGALKWFDCQVNLMPHEEAEAINAIRHALQQAQKIESGAMDMMIDDTICALKAIREEVGTGLKLSARSQNLGYQALDQLTAFKQFGILPKAAPEETKG